LSFCIGYGGGEYPYMTDTTRQLLDDLQASAPEVRIGLSRAGVTGVQKAVRIGRGARE
jgi:GTP cyclohydrolase FolE2